MSKGIHILLLILGIIMGFVGIVLNALITFIGCWLISCALGIEIAKIDRRILLAKVKLPLWEKKLLFPFQPNLFSETTIFSQRMYTYYAVIILLIYLFFNKDSQFILRASIGQVGLWAFSYIFLGMYVRKSNNTSEKERRKRQRKTQKMYKKRSKPKYK